MEISLPEIIDRITILKLKIENSRGLEIKSSFEKELQEYEKALKEFEEKGVEIKQEWVNKLYEINEDQWNLESLINKIKQEKNLEELGKIYVKLHISNKKRVVVKNEIAKKTGSGFKDIKVN